MCVKLHSKNLNPAFAPLTPHKLLNNCLIFQKEKLANGGRFRVLSTKLISNTPKISAEREREREGESK